MTRIAILKTGGPPPALAEAHGDYPAMFRALLGDGFSYTYFDVQAHEWPDPVAFDGAITRPSQLLDAVLAAGRKGLSISRYKGLGEMNAEQLWETTLDPENRALLQVKVEDADVTDEIFTRLMGDVVEPRREFIQDNALNVANLDV